jgi:hypothetical protein
VSEWEFYADTVCEIEKQETKKEIASFDKICLYKTDNIKLITRVGI